MLVNAHHECATETGVEEDVIKETLQGEFTEDEKLKKHILCVGQKLGFMNEGGELQTEVIKEKLGDVVDNVDELLEKCVVDKGSPEETAFGFAKCTYEFKHSD